MTRIIVAFTVAAALLHTAPLTAQDRWGFEARAGAAVPTADLGDAELGVGVGFEATLSYRFLDHLSAYAGWDWVHFTSDDSSSLGTDLDVEETGYAFGLRFEHPLRGEAGGPAAWVRAGGTWDHIEVEDDEGRLVGDSDHGLGWEVGAGVAVALGETWKLTPGIRYRALGADLEEGEATTSVDLQYLTFGIGVSRSF